MDSVTVKMNVIPSSENRCEAAVEHSIGNGEVDSSILSGSTRFPFENQRLSERTLPVPPRLAREQKPNSPQTVGENTGNLFTGCSVLIQPRSIITSLAGSTSSRPPRWRAGACRTVSPWRGVPPSRRHARPQPRHYSAHGPVQPPAELHGRRKTDEKIEQENPMTPNKKFARRARQRSRARPNKKDIRRDQNNHTSCKMQAVFP